MVMDCICIQRFSNQLPLKALYNIASLSPIIQTFPHRRWSQPCRATASSSGAVRVRRLARGHLDTHLGGAGDRTSTLRLPADPLYLLSPMPPPDREAPQRGGSCASHQAFSTSFERFSVFCDGLQNDVSWHANEIRWLQQSNQQTHVILGDSFCKQAALMGTNVESTLLLQCVSLKHQIKIGFMDSLISNPIPIPF